mmetsp:Transcript_29781/g.72581  ORF Transcript_29781/g.72581 Transcript_29781/m.72581 type:complete len:366 (-) Transcript_29781:274-1371(-)
MGDGYHDTERLLGSVPLKYGNQSLGFSMSAIHSRSRSLRISWAYCLGLFLYLATMTHSNQKRGRDRRTAVEKLELEHNLLSLNPSFEPIPHKQQLGLGLHYLIGRGRGCLKERKSIVNWNPQRLRGGQEASVEKRVAGCNETQPTQKRSKTSFGSGFWSSTNKSSQPVWPASNSSLKWMDPMLNKTKLIKEGIGLLFGKAAKVEKPLNTSQANSKKKTEEGDGASEEADVEKTSGESNETVLWEGLADLFEMHEENWVRRGRGPANVNIGKGFSRIIVRADRVNRLLFNAPIHLKMEFQPLGQNGLVFYAANYASRPSEDGEVKPKNETGVKKLETYALRFKDKPVTTDFLKAIKQAKDSLEKKQ